MFHKGERGRQAPGIEINSGPSIERCLAAARAVGQKLCPSPVGEGTVSGVATAGAFA